jgi:hypothetical protein
MKDALARRLAVGGALLAMTAGAATVWGADAPATLVVKAEVKKTTTGAVKGNWVKLTTDITVTAKAAKLMTVKVKADCKNGTDSARDEAMALGASLDKLAAGETKKGAEIRLFFDKGEAVAFEPKTCNLEFGWGKSTDKADFTPLSTMCMDGAEVKDGACP